MPNTNPSEDSETPQSRRARQPLPTQVDVAIIGAGLGGLMAAAHLTRAGLSVACFDAHYVAGGCATHFQRGGRSARYRFDIGLHYIGDCGPDGSIPRLLREVGVTLDYAALDPEGFDTLLFPDLRFAIPASLDLYRERLLAVFPAERRGVDRYLRLLRAVMAVHRSTSRSGGRLSPRALLPLGLSALLLARYQGATIGAFLDTCTRDPRLRAVLLGQSGDYGLPPSQVSAMMHLGLAGHYFCGAYYPKGGGQRIADELAAVIERGGGTIHLRRRVERVLLKDGSAVGLRLASSDGAPGPEVRARAVLSNADLPRTLLELIGAQNLPTSWVERSARFQMAAAIYITCLGIKADMRQKGMRASNYWQFDGYDMEGFYRDASAPGPLRPSGCYITSATLKDPENAAFHAPAGVTNVEVMTVLPGASARWHVEPADAWAWRYRDNQAYHDAKAAIEEQMIDRLERVFPGTREAVVFRESATPVTHSRFTGASEGTSYGLAATPEQFLRNRPGARGPLPQLYLCGASTRSGHGVLGALMGGQGAARRILGDLRGR